MAITDMLTNTVKDVVAIGQSLAKVVKEEVEMKINNRYDDEDEYDYDYDSKAYTSDYRSSLSTYFETFEAKAKDLIQSAFSGFSSSKSEEQEELERRIAALEAKLSKLVEESLNSIRKNDN